MPATTWRLVFDAIQAFADAHMTEDEYSALYGLGDTRPTADMWQYKPYGLPKEMYVEYYTKPQYVIRDGKAVLLDEGGERRMKPKIEFVYATEIDRHCVENHGATYEIKKVVRSKNLVFDRLLSATAVEA
ncbi:hypothetical protein [Chroococcidiopsis cubana]|nr:hypothetical protein [Chroococcidiopsis cubana]